MKMTTNEIKLRLNLIKVMNTENRIRYLDSLPKEIRDMIFEMETKEQEKKNESN